MKTRDMVNALSGMTALRAYLRAELAMFECLMQENERSSPADRCEDDAQMMGVYRLASGSLFAGLACIDEVVDWIHMIADAASLSDGDSTQFRLPQHERLHHLITPVLITVKSS